MDLLSCRTYCLLANGMIKPYFKSTQIDQLSNHDSSTDKWWYDTDCGYLSF